MAFEPVLAVHGGAGRVKNVKKITEAMINALRTGYDVMMETNNAVCGVEAAVACMEDCPLFNAGKGASLNENCGIECEALITDGSQKCKTGAVALTSNIRNPITLAKFVMECGKTAIITGKGASRFASEIGQKRLIVPMHCLVTTSAMKDFKEFKLNQLDKENGGCTAGAVALDACGRLASAVSTGGEVGKVAESVGCCAVPGAAGCSNNEIGAVSISGKSESVLRYLLANKVLQSMEDGSAQSSLETHVDAVWRTFQNACGGVAICCKGVPGVYFTSEMMPWAYRSGRLVCYGVCPGESNSCTV